MLKKILKFQTAIILIFVGITLATTQPVFAQTAAGSAACGGLTAVDSNACKNEASSGSTLGNLVSTVINILRLLVGAVAVIMILVAGIRFITSGGGEGVKAAKNTLIYALVGIAVAVLGQIMVHFVIHRLSRTPGSFVYPNNLTINRLV